MSTPTPRLAAFAALAFLPAAMACSSSQPTPHAEGQAHAEHRVLIVEADDEDYEIEILTDGDHGLHVMGDDQRSTIRIHDGDRELEIEKEGRVEMDDETGLVTSLSADARFSVEEEVDGVRRRMVVTPGPDGVPVHRFSVDGAERPFDDAARAWMQDALADVDADSDEHVYAMRVHEESMREHRDNMRLHRETMRGHRDNMREHRERLRDHEREVRVHRMRLSDADSLRKRVTIRDGVLTAIDDDGELVVIDLDSLVSTSMDAAMRAIDEMDFDFDFDFDFDGQDFEFSFDRDEMDAEMLREQADALEEAAAEMRREAEAVRREAEAAAREAERDGN